MFKKITISLLLLSISSFLMAAEFEVDFPLLGEVGFINESDHYSVSIGPLGTYSVEGFVNSSTHFDVTTDLPAGEFTDYIPVIGQIIGLFGLDTVKIHLSDKPSDGIAPDFGFGITLEAGGLGLIRGDITDALSLIPGISSVVDTVVSVLEIEEGEIYGKVTNDLKGDVSLYGTFNGTLSILTMKIGFDFTGNLSPEAIIGSLVDKIAPAASDMTVELSRYAFNQAKGAITGAYSTSLGAANQLFNEVGVIAHDVSASISHGSHNFDRCYGTCVPNYANRQSDRLREGSVVLFEKLYYSVYPSIILVNGNSPEETEQLRAAIIQDNWNKLSATIARKWDQVYEDDEVENYFFKSSSERKGRDRYKEIVQEDRSLYEQIRNGLYRRLMTDRGNNLLQSAQYVDSWTPGISVIETYRAGGSDFLVLLKPDHSMLWVLRLNQDGTLGPETWFTSEWQKGISAITTYEANGQNYLIASNPSNGSSWIFPLTADGQVSPPTWTNDFGWEKGISGLATYDANGRDYLLLSNPTNGHAWIYSLNANGTPGAETWFAGDWTLGNSQLETYDVNGYDVLLLSNPEKGYAWLFGLTSEGKIGNSLWETTGWEKGINTTSVLKTSAGTFTFLYNSSNGHAWLYKMNDDGSFGPNLWTTDQWETCVSYIKGYESGSGRFLLLSKPNGKFWSFRF